MRTHLPMLPRAPRLWDTWGFLTNLYDPMLLLKIEQKSPNASLLKTTGFSSQDLLRRKEAHRPPGCKHLDLRAAASWRKNRQRWVQRWLGVPLEEKGSAQTTPRAPGEDILAGR